jgi:DNA-directed RNA polymerase subunit RPC12/RpoP
MESAELDFECGNCGHKHRIVSIPTSCPACGSGRSVKPPESEAETKARSLDAKFRLAAERAKGNF